MTCAEIQKQLHEAQLPEVELSAQAETHVATCPACQSVRQDLVSMRAALQSAQPPALPDGFELSLRRRLTQAASEKRAARPAPSRRRTLGVMVVAAAAMLLVALGVVTWLGRVAEVPQMSMAFYQLHLSIRSQQEHPQTQIDVQLPDGVRAETSVALALGGNGLLRWQSKLGAGVNEIDLPLVASQGASGTVQVKLTVAGKTVTSSVPLNARAQRPGGNPGVKQLVKLALVVEHQSASQGVIR